MATPRKRHASAPTEISTPSPKRQRTVLTLEKKIELIIASVKNQLYTHKDQQYAKNRYYFFIYCYKNIKKTEKNDILTPFKYKPLLRKGL